MPMIKDIKDRWVKALRSGRYTQCSESLVKYEDFANPDKETNCCLGVLCRVMRQPREDWENYNELDLCEGSVYEDALATGLTDENMLTLMRMNDGTKGKQYSFKEIADHIEKWKDK
jgi:hypothetical protein